MNDPATLAPSSWPKFRHDVQNTGSVENAAVQANPGKLRWAFPPLGQSPKGSFIASPVISVPQPGSAETRNLIYTGSNDGRLYAVFDDGTENTGFIFSSTQPITSTALVTVRDKADALFVGGADGLLYGLTATGTAQASFWPTTASGFVSAAPTISADGVVYVASQAGALTGVCPNGIDRFVYSTTEIESSPAEGPDITVYFGASDGLLRAVQYIDHYHTALVKWTFSAAKPIRTAPVAELDPSINQIKSIYVGDTTGHLYKVSANGQPDAAFQFTPRVAGAAVSSPALAGNHLYFASEDGNLYAVNKTTGDIDWAFPIGTGVTSPPTPLSSPAVATNGAQPPVIVVGSNAANGAVYFVQDNNTSAALLVPAFAIGAPVHSSPAIGRDGTVYVGADDGRLYAIGTPLP
jgi:outer membrane protein assembly factor BamB